MSNGAGAPVWINIPGGTTYTASNGITLAGTEFKLGGSLTANTTIAGAYNLNLSQGSLTVGTTTTTASLNLSSTSVGGSSVAAFLSGNSGLVGYLDTSNWDKSTADDYSYWRLTANGTGSTNITNGTTVNFANGVGISLAQAGSTITINNSNPWSDSSNAYIQNQFASNQNASFRISGNGQVGNFFGIGSTSTSPLNVGLTNAAGSSANFLGNITAQKLIDQANSYYFLDPAISDASKNSLSLYMAGSVKFNVADSGTPTHIISGAASRIQNFTNGLLLATDTGTTAAAAVSNWENGLFLSTNGAIGIGFTNPNPLYKLDIGGTLQVSNLAIGGTTVIATPTELNYLSGLAVTNGGVIYTNGTKLANTGVGSSGQYLMSNGAGAPVWTNVGAGGSGATYYAGNGLNLSGTTFNLGGALTQNTRLNIGNTEVLYINYPSGRIGIGTTNPASISKLTIEGNTHIQGLESDSYALT
ncbi:MAG TPA: hypothetical protein PK131_03220, partial [Candidatus Woesebacteria bacterium]|nr:hypothetical protein [Candidatus Woesebacteria bacterium]